MTSMESVFARKKPAFRSAWLLLDQGLADQKGALERRLRLAERQVEITDKAEQAAGAGMDSEVPDLQAKVDALAAELEALNAVIEEARQEFTFKAIGANTWREMKEKHPEDDEEAARKIAADEPLDGFNVDTLAPELIAAASVEPVITPEDAQRMFAEWSEGEVAKLFKAAYLVQVNTRDVSFGEPGTAATRNSGPSSTTPQAEVSPTASS